MITGQSIPIIENLFYFTYIYNPGAAFGIMYGQRVVLTVITASLIIGILIFIYTKARKEHFLFPLSLAIICGGGLGNLIDRVRIGAVVDFFDVTFFSPIFNVADVFVCIGCGLLVIYMIFFDKPKEDVVDDAAAEV